jgi:hypothetical protein
MSSSSREFVTQGAGHATFVDTSFEGALSGVGETGFAMNGGSTTIDGSLSAAVVAAETTDVDSCCVWSTSGFDGAISESIPSAPVPSASFPTVASVNSPCGDKALTVCEDGVASPFAESGNSGCATPAGAIVNRTTKSATRTGFANQAMVIMRLSDRSKPNRPIRQHIDPLLLAFMARPWAAGHAVAVLIRTAV